MPPIKSLRPKAKWEPVKIKVDMDDGKGKTTEVEAECLGTLAVHKGALPRDAGKWAVTHIPLGVLVTVVGTEVDARKIAEFLWSGVSYAFSKTQWERVIGNLPFWVRPWCVACRKKGKYLDPQSFMEGSK